MPDIRSARIGAGFALAPAGFAAIAQLVEHVIRNDGVGGSNPSCGTSASILGQVHFPLFAIAIPVGNDGCFLSEAELRPN